MAAAALAVPIADQVDANAMRPTAAAPPVSDHGQDEPRHDQEQNQDTHVEPKRGEVRHAAALATAGVQGE
jgi:hypothetical protein